MLDKRCFLNNCNATVDDAVKYKDKCVCLSCLGDNCETCELLSDENPCKRVIQHVKCSQCANYKSR